MSKEHFDDYKNKTVFVGNVDELGTPYITSCQIKEELSKKVDTNHQLVEQMAKLEEENTELKAQLQIASERIDVLSNKNIELSNQFEKMKRCGNCKNSKCISEDVIECEVKSCNADRFFVCDKWELAE